MDLRVLKYFQMIAKVGNITQAANELHITQPTLSRQMMELEEELGVKLFERGKRHITLTDSGILYLQRVNEILNLVEKTHRDIREDQEQVAGNLAIGCVESYASRKLAQIITAFHEKHPKVTYEIYSADGDDIREKLDRGALDIGILIEPIEVAKYDFMRLPIKETWGILVKAQDPLAIKDQVKSEDLRGRSVFVSRRGLVIEELEQWLQLEENDIHVMGSHNLLFNSIPLVLQGQAIAITIEGAYNLRRDEQLKFIPLEPRRYSIHVLAWKKNQHFHQAVKLFIEMMNNSQDIF